MDGQFNQQITLIEYNILLCKMIQRKTVNRLGTEGVSKSSYDNYHGMDNSCMCDCQSLLCFLKLTGQKYHNNGLLVYYGLLMIWFVGIVFFISIMLTILTLLLENNGDIDFI